MKKEEILKKLQEKNKNIRLPSEMDFTIQDNVLTIGMTEKGLISNMQTDAAAFEGWAICLKAWLPEFVDKVIIKGDPQKDKNNRHYKRFLYRLNKFTQIYYSWVKSESYTEDFKVFENTKKKYLNVPKKEASEEATHCEAQLERAYCLKNRSFYTALDHQLPARIFNKSEIKEENAITPGGFIDIWGIKNNTLKIFELKLPTNTEIGIISELMFYVNVMSDVLQHEINIPQRSEFRSFEKLYELYENKGTCKQIEGVFLAEKFHPLIQEKQEEVLQIINSGKFPEDTPVCFSFDKPDVEIFYHQSDKVGKPKKLKTYKEQQKDRQLKLLYQSNGIFEGAHGCGYFKNNMYPYVLLPKDSVKNLFVGIRKNCSKYFEENSIYWWGGNKSNIPGHLLSSQIHCLNHLFALRQEDAVADLKQVMEQATNLKIEKIFPSPIDLNGGYITFEFTCNNKLLLGERTNSRGANCTSIDALVYVLTKDNKKTLIPIEWKYTECYNKNEKNKADKDTVEKRYLGLVDEKSNLKEWPEEFYYNPLYEFARQTLLIEQIITKKPKCGRITIEADDYVHLIVRPNENVDIIGDIQRFKDEKRLKNIKKVIEIAPQSLLSPLESNAKYKDLITYLKTRYW